MQQIFDFPVQETSTLENFIVCDGNAAGLQFARRIADPEDPECLLYLHGPQGAGKTHLLKGLCRVLPPGAAYFSFRQEWRPEQLLQQCSAATALLLDDLQLIPLDQDVYGAVWQAFNDFHDSGRITVLAGRMPPRELPNLDDHLISRLLWGLVARMDVSDDHSRRMILKKIADDRQVRVPDEVVDHILMTTGREVCELIRTFEALYRLSVSEKKKISVALARESRERGVAGELP